MKYIYCILLLSVILGSCRKNMEDIDTIDFPDPPKTLVNTSLVGIVTDEVGVEITDFEVHFNNKITQWSGSHYFKLDGKLINQNGEPLTIITPDGTQSVYSVKTIKEDVNYVHFAIIKQKEKATHDLKNDIRLNSSDEFKVDLKKESFKKNGILYSGNVKTESFLIDPEHIIQRQTLPGSNQGLNLQKEITALDILHAFYLDIRSDDGTLLTTRLQIQADRLPSLPQDQFVWWFDPVSGFWNMLETSFADAKSWQTQFTQPGFYCISAQKSGVRISGKVTLGVLPVPGCSIDIQSASGHKITIQTSNAGIWNALVPKGQDLTLNIYNECGEFGSESIGSFNTDTYLGVSDISAFSSLFSVLKGTVKDCDGKLKNNSFLYFEGDGLNNKIFNPGSQIEVVIPICQNEHLTISFSDISGAESCSKILWHTKPEMDVNSMFACDRAKGQYFNLMIESENKMYWEALSSSTGGRLKIQLADPGNAGFEFGIWIPAFSVTELQDDMINILLNDASFGSGGYSLFCPTSTLGCGFEKLVITHYPQTGDEWIRGYFEGTFWIKRISPPEANNRKMRGEFQIRKAF